MIAKFARLEFELFTKPSNLDFLRACQPRTPEPIVSNSPTHSSLTFMNINHIRPLCFMNYYPKILLWYLQLVICWAK